MFTKNTLMCPKLLLLFLIQLINKSHARYAVTSKFTKIDNTPTGSEPKYKSVLEGNIYNLPKDWFEGQKKPCYIYFADEAEITVNFVNFDKASPLDVTSRNLFFWPYAGQKNFTVTLMSDLYLDDTNTNIFCGDISDILGENAIEYQRAESIKIGSFPKDPNELTHPGYIKLEQPVLPGCNVNIYFPTNKIPYKFELLNHQQLEQITVQVSDNKRVYTLKGLDAKSYDFELNHSVIPFKLSYSDIESIAYSYNMVAEVSCNYDGETMDQQELRSKLEKEKGNYRMVTVW